MNNKVYTLKRLVKKTMDLILSKELNWILINYIVIKVNKILYSIKYKIKACMKILKMIYKEIL